MKRCPECRRDYYDNTMLYCLDDGSALLEGPASANERVTAVLTGPSASAGDAPDTAQTRILDPSGTETGKPLKTGRQNFDRKVSRKFIVACGLGILVITAFVIGSYLYFGRESSRQIDSLAVLPFENGTGDANLDYLSEGLSESLIDKLAQLPQLKVIARSSSFKFRGPEINLQDIANKLGVQAIVSGKINKQGDQITVRVEMVDARDNKQVFGERYIRNANDAQAIQREIAQTVSNKLTMRLSGSQEKQLTKVGTSNSQAYEFYLKGLFFRGKSGGGNLKASNQFFLKATEADAEFAAAHANLALTYLILAGNGMLDPTEAHPKAEVAAHKAIELDETLAESHLALAGLLRDKWKWKEAAKEYEAAVGLNPNLAEAHRRYAQFLSLVGRHDEAVAAVIHARELDPISPRINSYVAYVYLFARRYDEAITSARKSFALDPNNNFAYLLLGYIYSANGQHGDAIESYKKTIELGDDSTSVQVYLGTAYADAGESEKAMEILDKLRRSKEYVSPGELAALYVALGMKEEAFLSLEKAFAVRDLQLQYLKVDAAFDRIRSDRRFTDLLTRVGLQDLG